VKAIAGKPISAGAPFRTIMIDLWSSFPEFKSYFLEHRPYCRGCKPPTPMAFTAEWPEDWKMQFTCTACGDILFEKGYPEELKIKWIRK
jgi:hypothetical protein